MACYHPLKGFKIGINPNTGKDKLKIVSYKTDHIELRSDGKYYPVEYPELSTIDRNYTDFVDIPCGRCIGCRLSRSKQWADRAVLELQYHAYNYFITLTYSDDFVPSSEFVDKDSGEVGEALTLCKKDLQDYIKRLRRHFEPAKCRHLSVGEYGSETLRPHYHQILFSDFEIPDLKFYGFSNNGDPLYESQILDSIWKKGKVWIGEATWESIAYVARYVNKKLYGAEAEYYKIFNIVPEFLTCSLKPAIGRMYYEDHKEELFSRSQYFFPRNNGVGSAYPSRYFNNLFEVDFDHDDVEHRKTALKAQFEARKELKLENTSKTYLDYLEDEEYNKKCQIKKLQRDL